MQAFLHRFYAIHRHAALLWYYQSADALSATVSFYMIFAITPFLLLVITFTSFLYGQSFVETTLTTWGRVLGPEMVSLLSASVTNLEVLTNGYAVPFIGVLFFSGMVVVLMNTVTNSLHILWGVRQSGFTAWYKKSLRSMLFIAILILYFVTLLAGNKLIIAGFSDISVWLSEAVYTFFFVVLTTALFTEAFYLLPTRSPNHHARVLGGFMVSVLLFFLKSFVSLYLLTTPTPGLFGTAGLILVFLIWSYASAAVIFYGAAVADAIDPVPRDPVHDLMLP